MAIYSPNALIGTGVALPFLGLVAVFLRYYVRLKVRRTFIGADDLLVLLAVILVCGHGVIQVLMVEFGVAGQDDVLPSTYEKNRVAVHQKLSHAILVIEKVTYVSIKLSFLFLYRRVFGASRTFRRTVDVLSALIVIWGLLFLFLEIFGCVSDAFTSSTTCAAQEWILLWFAITEVLGDMVILSLPYPCLRRLQISRRDKYGLTVIFGLGTMSTMAGIIRLGYVAKTFYCGFNNTASAPGFWTTAEVSIGVLASCLPPLGPILRLMPGPSKVYHSIRDGLHYSWSRTRRMSTTIQSNHEGTIDATANHEATIAIPPSSAIEKQHGDESRPPGMHSRSSDEETLKSDGKAEGTWYKSGTQESDSELIGSRLGM